MKNNEFVLITVICSLFIITSCTKDDSSPPMPMSNLIASSSGVNFKETFIGTFSSSQLLLTNSGDQRLNIDSLSIQGDAFQLGSNAVSSLQAGSSTKIEITFTPTSDSIVNGQLIIHNDSPNDPRMQITLTGIGKQHQLVGGRWIGSAESPNAFSSVFFVFLFDLGGLKDVVQTNGGFASWSLAGNNVKINYQSGITWAGTLNESDSTITGAFSDILGGEGKWIVQRKFN